MRCLGFMMFGERDIVGVRCLGCDMFQMWDFKDVGCLGYGVLGISVHDEGSWRCGMFKMRNFLAAGCPRCGIFRIRDVQNEGCGMFIGMYNVGLQIPPPPKFSGIN